MTEEKRNYNEEFKDFLKGLDKDSKPTLFLHACCGPCLTYPLSILAAYFDVTIGFLNPNIYPESEYDKRFEELERFVIGFNKENQTEVKVIKFPYAYEEYLEAVKGHEKDKEGGERCTICHTLRLEESFRYADEHEFDFFTTVMTVSSKKPSQLLNEIGISLQTKYKHTRFITADFKKEDGQLKGILIAKKFSLYRQNYCGCSFSLEARKAFEEEKKKQGLIG